MPLYEYKCLSCEKVHEIMQKFSDPLVENCPECGGTVNKLMSLGSFALKGNGWYTTDYKRSGSSANSQAKGQTQSQSSSQPNSQANSTVAPSVTGSSSTGSASSSSGSASGSGAAG